MVRIVQYCLLAMCLACILVLVWVYVGLCKIGRDIKALEKKNAERKAQLASLDKRVN